jgi:hypothetical protein
MSSLAIVDLDGVVANSDARFVRATNEQGRVNWKVAFDPELVTLDTLIPGADKAIKMLEERRYNVSFLTSRPEHMRATTESWLAQHGLDSYDLVMKPASAQFTKTVVWKAETVTQIVKQTGTDMILFIDDEEANCKAVENAIKALEIQFVCLPNLEASDRYHAELVKGMLSWIDDGIEEIRLQDEKLEVALEASNDGGATAHQESYYIHVERLEGHRIGVIVQENAVVLLEDNLGSINEAHAAIHRVAPDLEYSLLEWVPSQYPY